MQEIIKSCNAKRRRQRRRTVKKTTIGLISNKGTLHVQRTIFVHFFALFFARLQRETSRNFFYGGNGVRVLVHFFFTHFLLALSPPLQNFHVVLPTKKMSPLFFISRSRSLLPFFSLSFAGLPLFLFFSAFLLLYIPNLWT